MACGKAIRSKYRKWAWVSSLVSLLVVLLWLSGGLSLLVSLAYNNYGSLRLNRALLGARSDESARQANMTNAGQAFQAALAWTPWNGLSYYNLGTIYGEWGQPEAAAQAFAQAAADLPWDVSTHFQLGQAYAALGRDDMAMPEWRAARASHYFITQSRRQLAAGDAQGAAHSLKVALELEPNLPEAHYALGQLYANQDRTAEAIRAYQAGLSIDRSPSSRLAALAQVAVLQQDWTAALDYYGQAQKLNPNSPALRLRIGQAYASLGRLEQAAVYYGQALQLDSGYVPAYASLAALSIRTGNCRQAVEYLEQGLTLDRTGEFGPELSVSAASCFTRAGQPAQAIPLLERAVERRPDVIAYRLALAQAYASGAQFQDAIREYRAVLRLEPGNARARVGLQSLNASEK